MCESNERKVPDVTGKNVFVSGPMTGVPLLNAPEFARAHMWLIEHGAASVYDPVHEYFRLCGREPTQTHEEYIRRCVNELTRTAPDGGAHYGLVVQLAEWKGSWGAYVEQSVARSCGIECVEMAELVGDGGEKAE